MTSRSYPSILQMGELQKEDFWIFKSQIGGKLPIHQPYPHGIEQEPSWSHYFTHHNVEHATSARRPNKYGNTVKISTDQIWLKQIHWCQVTILYLKEYRVFLFTEIECTCVPVFFKLTSGNLNTFLFLSGNTRTHKLACKQNTNKGRTVYLTHIMNNF